MFVETDFIVSLYYTVQVLRVVVFILCVCVCGKQIVGNELKFSRRESAVVSPAVSSPDERPYWIEFENNSHSNNNSLEETVAQKCFELNNNDNDGGNNNDGNRNILI